MEISKNNFGNYVEYSQGVIPYESASDKNKASYISSKREGEGWLPLFEKASQVRRYSIESPISFIKYGPWLGRSREQKFFSSHKILFHRLRKKLPRQIVATIDTSGAINRHSLSNLILKTN